MKKGARLLLDKAIASLILSIEHFNKPSDLGRSDAVLILLDHAFEMLLKASLLHKGGRIRERGAEQTIGFDACVRRGLSTGHVQFLTADQALSLQIINSLRDAAQHHLVVVSESQLREGNTPPAPRPTTHARRRRAGHRDAPPSRSRPTGGVGG